MWILIVARGLNFGVISICYAFQSRLQYSVFWFVLVRVPSGHLKKTPAYDYESRFMNKHLFSFCQLNLNAPLRQTENLRQFFFFFFKFFLIFFTAIWILSEWKVDAGKFKEFAWNIWFYFLVNGIPIHRNVSLFLIVKRVEMNFRFLHKMGKDIILGYFYSYPMFPLFLKLPRPQ